MTLSELIVLGEKKISEKKYKANRRNVRRQRAEASFNSMVAERTLGTALGSIAAVPATVLITNALKKRV